MILLDTSVVSAVLRRRRPGEKEVRLAARLDALLATDETVGVPGIVLQEVLSGIAEPRQMKRVLDAVQEGFPVILAREADHIRAAELVNAGARRGVAVSTPDALIAAQALGLNAALLTTDQDFGRVARLWGLRLAT